MRDTIRRRFLLAAMTLALACSVPDSAAACGTVDGWVDRYHGAANSDRRAAVLRELSAWCGSYRVGESDRRLLGLLTNALETGLERSEITRVFQEFRCLMAAREDSSYRALRDALPDAQCPAPNELVRWRTITGSGVRLRDGPSTATRRIGVLTKSQVVEEIGTEGAWRQVRTWTGQSGFVHGSLVGPYPSGP